MSLAYLQVCPCEANAQVSDSSRWSCSVWHQRHTKGIRVFCLTKCSQSEIRIKTQERFSWRGCHLLVAWMVRHTWDTIMWECSDVCSAPPSPFGSLPFIVYSSQFKAKWEKERQKAGGHSASLNIFLKSASIFISKRCRTPGPKRLHQNHQDMLNKGYFELWIMQSDSRESLRIKYK